MRFDKDEVEQKFTLFYNLMKKGHSENLQYY